MDFLSERCKGMKPPLTGGFEKAKMYTDIINLTVGDPDIKTPNTVLDKAMEKVKAGYTNYSPGKGYTELRQLIVDYYNQRYPVEIEIDNVMAATSGGYSMFLALCAVINQGDEVIIIEPYFAPYLDQVKLAGGVPVFVTMVEEEGFQINIEQLEQAVTPKTRGIIINSPCNPVGVVYDIKTLESIRDFVVKHDILVFADDIYTDFCYGKRFTPIMSVQGMFERTITINSFSKNYVMTGFRLANIVAPKYLLDAIGGLNDNMIFSPPCFSQWVGYYAMSCSSAFSSITEEFQKRIEYSVSRINALNNIHILPPEGAFYLFPNIKATGLTSNQVCDKIFEETHIMVTPGSDFGSGGEGYIRICATVGIEVLKEVFDRLGNMDLFKQN